MSNYKIDFNELKLDVGFGFRCLSQLLHGGPLALEGRER